MHQDQPKHLDLARQGARVHGVPRDAYNLWRAPDK
jgi:hypothetical protein